MICGFGTKHQPFLFASRLFDAACVVLIQEYLLYFYMFKLICSLTLSTKWYLEPFYCEVLTKPIERRDTSEYQVATNNSQANLAVLPFFRLSFSSNGIGPLSWVNNQSNSWNQKTMAWIMVQHQYIPIDFQFARRSCKFIPKV